MAPTRADESGDVDSHFHIWELNRFQYDYPTADIPEMFKDFTIVDLENAAKDTPVRHGVYVQVPNGGRPAEELEWITQLAKDHSFVKGIVAGFGLNDPKLPGLLDQYQSNTLMKGIRNIIDMEADDAWILRPEVQEGVALVGQRGLVVDICPSPRHWPHLVDIVKTHQSVQFVIDHLGKPVSGAETRPGWKEWITKMAACPNVHCKISSQLYAYRGEPTEAEKQGILDPKDEEIIQHALSVFGVDRCMYGSDWPPALLASPSYGFFHKIVSSSLEHLTESERRQVFAKNCISFYNLQF